MSRHRNVRSINYNDEYDGYDDVYGHSVEDEYCISPSDEAEFMYDRTRQPQMSAFFSEEDNIVEEDESADVEQPRRDKKLPILSDLDEAKLHSCLDEIRSVVGESLPENTLIEIILKSDFQVDKALDSALSSVPSAGDKTPADVPKPQRVRKDRERDDDVVSPEFSDLFDDILQDEDINGIRKGVENMEICGGSRHQALSLISNLVLDSDCPRLSESDVVGVKEKISSLQGISSLTNNLRVDRFNDLDDLFDCIVTKPKSNNPFVSNVLTPQFSSSQSLHSTVGYQVSLESNISSRNFEDIVSENHPGVYKSRKDSDKENFKVLSSDESDDEEFITPHEILMRQNKKLERLKRKMLPLLTPSSLCQVKELSITTQAAKLHQGDYCGPKGERVSLCRKASYDQPEWRGNCRPSEEDSVSTQRLFNESFSEEMSRKQTEKVCKDNDPSNSSSQSTFLGHQKLMVGITEKYPMDDSSSEDDDFSPLMSLAKLHVKDKSHSKALIISEVNLLEDPMDMVYNDSNSESELSSERSDLTGLTNTMSDSLSISQGSEKEVGSFSSLASLIARHSTSGAVEPSPPSSLFDLANNHLTRSSSCWKVKADGEPIDKKSVSLTDTNISKSVPGRFFIPNLGMLQSSMSSNSEMVLAGQDDTSDQSEDGDNWVFDLSSALRVPGSVPHNETMKTRSEPKIIPIQIIEPPSDVEFFPCQLDASTILKRRFCNAKRKSSSFGKALCRKWRSLALPYIPPRPKSVDNLVRFSFDEPSPDDHISKAFPRMY